MFRTLPIIAALLLACLFVNAQNDDSLPPRQDSITRVDTTKVPVKTPIKTPVKAPVNPAIDTLTKDSIISRPVGDILWKPLARNYSRFDLQKSFHQSNRFFAFGEPVLIVRNNLKVFVGKEVLFYSLLMLLLFFALVKLSFPKYITDLFRVTFRTTSKQRQISEQLIQVPFPSILLNLLFFLTTAFYINFLLQYYQLATDFGFWTLFLYCFGAMAAFYLVKFLALKISGLVFNISDSVNAYIFTIYLINKVLGIFLLPFVLILAFADKWLYSIALTASFVLISALVAYRFILTYGLVRNQIKFNPFHFFLYLLAFEIAPLLLIYKLLLRWFH